MLGKTVLGRYRILRSLGSGNNGEAFLAEPLRFPEYRVVVKRIHDEVVAHPKFRQLFEAEVRSMGNFEHPYAVGLVEASLDDPIGPCLVMEYVPGVTLEDLLLRQKRLDVKRTGRLLGCFCHALQAAHSAGIIHRDLKPANLMVHKPGAPDESLKVMDFGFAGFVAKPHIQLSELTGRGPIFAIGTPGYVSPEMIRGDRVDCRSDLYSVGVILFEMLTGWLPFNYTSQDHLLAAHVKDAPPRFVKIGCTVVPPAVEAVVQRLLSKYPIERPQTARELIEEYSRAADFDYWEATAPPGWEPPAPPQTDPDISLAVTPAPGDPYHVVYAFQVYLPEPMAGPKLRGFVEDCKAEVLESEPGLIRMSLGGPKPRPQPKSSGLLGWLVRDAQPPPQPAEEPMDIELYMEKTKSARPQLHVVVSFQPRKGTRPKHRGDWLARCEKYYNLMRQYLGA